MANGIGYGVKHLAQTDGFKWLHLMITALAIPLVGVVYVEMRGHIQANSDQVARNTTALATISSNRFTSNDALEVWREIGEIRASIAALPPRDFKEKMSNLEAQVSEVNAAVGRLEEWAKTQGRSR